MDDCLFCKIAAKKISAHVIYEDDDTLAFLDIMPRTKGHTIVIPKVHAQPFSIFLTKRLARFSMR